MWYCDPAVNYHTIISGVSGEVVLIYNCLAYNMVSTYYFSCSKKS